MTTAAAKARIAELETQLAAKASKATPKITLKVSAKGGLSVYGLGRWPVTLYQGQWKILISIAPDITAFIEANQATLSSKE